MIDYRGMKKFLIALFFAFAASAYAADTADCVACVGRIIPKNRVQKLAAAAPTGGQPVIDALNVKQGDIIKAGDTVAVIAGEQTAAAALKRAKAALATAKSAREIAVAERKNAAADIEGEIQQISDILADKDPPRREREELQYNKTSLLRKLAHAREMARLVEQNQNDIVSEAEIAVDEAEKIRNSYFVKSPINGKVLEVHVKKGEAIPMEGVCEIADLSELFVEAEIYVADAPKVNVGADATITSDAVAGKTFAGKVESVSASVRNNKVFSADPGEFSNLKVVRAKIRLGENSDALKNLIGSQVNIRIAVKK